MYQIAVCDDEQEDLSQAVVLTWELLEQAGVACSVAAYEAGDALLADIRDGRRFDLLLLDVLMEGLDGLALAGALKDLEDRPDVVFVSSSRDMALMGYYVDAKRYLAKPLDRSELQEALLYCHQEARSRRERRQQLLLPTESGEVRLPAADIRYAEPFGRHSLLALPHGREVVRLPLSQLADLLPQQQFILCHRTVLVNLAYVQRLDVRELELTTGEVLPVSRYRLPQVRKKLLDLLNS